MLGNTSLFGVLQYSAYRRLFAAQVVSLLGTGLASIALGLLVFELGGANAGVILGTVLAIKIIAYVTTAPVAEALLGNLPRRTANLFTNFSSASCVCRLHPAISSHDS
jgi:multisubunit Na+/H+ antiporter MnhG subunit